MDKIKLSSFLKDLSFNTEYRFLEQGKDDNDLAKVAEKCGISLPAKDLAIFKGKYAFTDRTNLNGCSLPKAEVEKSLPTLFGKAIDFDHIRERIVGFWLTAELVGDVIYSYGAFFKTNLAEDYALVKELMDKNNLGISFEAYGTREFKKDGSYDLKDIEWAGGALLINTKPAFPGAGVLEMSNQRVLEFASAMTEPKEYIKSKEEKKLEKARMYTSDMETIMRLCGEITCPMCKTQGCIDINEIDFKDNSVEAKCWMCDCNMDVELTPKSTMALPDDMANIREIKSVTQVVKKEEGKMSKTQTETPSIEKAESLIKDEEVITVEKAEVEEVVEPVVEVVVPAEANVVVTEEPAVVEPIVEVSKDIKALADELASTKAQLVKARDEGKVIGERRAFLGDFAKDMTDDDVLDSVKYENATLKKEVSELKSKTTQSTEIASVTVVTTEKESTPLEIGSKDKTKSGEIDALAKNVRKRAFNI